MGEGVCPVHKQVSRIQREGLVQFRDLAGKENWKKLNLIGMVESQQDVDGTISTEKRFHIASL